MEKTKPTITKVGMNTFITEPASIKIHADKHLEKGRAIHVQKDNSIVMNEIDLANVILQMADGDYSVLFATMGIDDSIIGVACENANKIVNKSIEENYQKAIKKFEITT